MRLAIFSPSRSRLRSALLSFSPASPSTGAEPWLLREPDRPRRKKPDFFGFSAISAPAMAMTLRHVGHVVAKMDTSAEQWTQSISWSSPSSSSPYDTADDTESERSRAIESSRSPSIPEMGFAGCASS